MYHLLMYVHTIVVDHDVDHYNVDNNKYVCYNKQSLGNSAKIDGRKK
jgi:hypothetical protein